jgi:exodeoxyribonuclease X
MRIVIIDTETTGLDPATDRVVQIAAALVEIDPVDGTGTNSGLVGSSMVNPRRPIPPEASAVHHILDKHVVDAPDLDRALEAVLGLFWRESVTMVAAHNCRFDMGFLPMLKEGRQWIDTYRCALHVWPDAPNHQNWTLFYWRGLRRDGIVNPHSADADVLATADVLCELLKERPVDELLTLSRKAAVLKRVGFGKHFGKLWTAVPIDYLDWAVREDRDFDADVMFTIKTELRRRADAAASTQQEQP